MLKRLFSLSVAFVTAMSCIVLPTVYADYPSSLSAEQLLKLSLDYCETMDKSVYVNDAAMTSFESKLESAKTLHDNASVSESSLTTARSELEKAKANLKFVQSEDTGNPLPFRKLSRNEVVAEMGVGWNLGNTMDGHSGFTPGETVWQTVTTTPDIIKEIHDAGFNTVRIPVTWGNMIDDKNGYAINEAWISRVQDIVDYCTELGMYAIINIHHDGAEQSGWLRVAEDNIDVVYEKYACVWRNIAKYFKDYDEHLIFESLNEITSMEDSNKNSDTAKKFDVPIIVNLNQIFVNVVRSTGSNNVHRWLSVASHYANSTDNYFSMPTDSYNSDVRLMYAAHIYKHSTKTSWTYDQVYEVVNGIRGMYNKYKKYPLILGEYGNRSYTLSGAASGWNDEERAWFDEIVTRACQVAGCVPCVWDQGMKNWADLDNHLYSVWDRTKNEPIFKSITDGMMRGMYLPATSSNKSYNMKDIAKSPSVTKITDIGVPEKVELTLGGDDIVSTSVTPSNTNDIVLWKSDNSDIATVSNGKIHAAGIGSTTVHAFSQSGSIDKTINVMVKAKQTVSPALGIETDADEYTVVTGRSVNINAKTTGSDENVTYASSNTAVAAVNALGKVVGISEGTAYVIITAESGVTKAVKIKSVKSAPKDSMNLALHVLYNDSAKNYYGTELSEPVEVKGDGQYTVSFDLSTQQSAAGKKAGITDISKLTAIYIKDYDVTNGAASVSPVDRCNVRYDKVVVDGNELTITSSDYKSAFNGDVVDTGAPVNAWGGTVVKEVTIDSKNHVASFSSVANPKKIEVTFTLSDVHFREEESLITKPVTEMTAVGEAVVLAHTGEDAEIAVNVLPIDTTEKITFCSADKSAVIVNDSSVEAAADGTAKVNIHFIKDGEITAISESGKTVVFSIRKAVEPVIEGNKIIGVEGYIGQNMPETFEVITAVYDGEAAVEVEPVTAGHANITDGVLVLNGLDIPIEDGQNAKVFIWDSLENIRPIK